MKYFFTALTSLFIHICIAQQPPITPAVYEQWPKLERPAISNNGKYLSYIVNYANPILSKPISAVLTSSDLKWQKKLTGPGPRVLFLGNSQYATVMFSNDSLAIIQLGSDNIEWVEQVSSCSIIGNEMIAFKQKNKSDDFILKNLTSGKIYHFPNVKRQESSKDERYMALVCINKQAPPQTESLKLVNLTTMQNTTIWKGGNISNIKWSNDMQTIAFMENENEKETIWLHKIKNNKTVKITDNRSLENANYKFTDILKFSSDGLRLFVILKERLQKAPADAVKLDIWTYKDASPQTRQLNGLHNARTSTWAFSFASQKFTKLSTEEEGWLRIPEDGNDDWGILGGHRWTPGVSLIKSAALVSTKDGRRIKLSSDYVRLSPQGKYHVLYDEGSNQFISYEIATGISRTITQNISTIWKIMEPNAGGYARGGIIGWMKDDEAVVVYDQFDIWAIDMAGIKPPQNLTNGLGKKINSMFFLLKEEYNNRIFLKDEVIILTAFNPQTKENGFYKMQFGKITDPEKLIMGPYVFSLSRNPYVPPYASSEAEPVKAKEKDIYIVQKQSETEFPNYFITEDFKKFKPLTNLHPEKQYNWFTTELHEWKTKEGKKLQGALYKPQNFDSTKKYPVIFYFYTKKSDNLHVYLYPKPSNGVLNIEWYASNGFLVFTPDIFYTYGNAYENCLSSLESAAQYLSTLPFVNKNKMGITGSSWGGFQTNYIVTHSSLFAAACSGSSIADFVAHYNCTTHGGMVINYSYEHGTMGSGKTLWEDPDWFMKNSPVMNADKTTTPLLMFETTNDGACPFLNALELFYALRRLGKKVWVLEYNDGNHGVDGKSALDFDVRQQQFFSHFLKDAPPPKWMTQGRPAYLKGIDERLEYDLDAHSDTKK